MVGGLFREQEEKIPIEWLFDWLTGWLNVNPDIYFTHQCKKVSPNICTNIHKNGRVTENFSYSAPETAWNNEIVSARRSWL